MRTSLRSYLRATTLVELIPTKSILVPRASLREDLGDIEGLAKSIRKDGLLEPIIVRPLDTKFEIVAGHRRFEACRVNRLHEIPSIVMNLSDKDAYALSLIENLQRKTLSPIEEAESFKHYVNKFGYGSVSELARSIGMSEEYVSHRIMLLNLPLVVQEQIRRRLLTASDAWEISRVKDSQKQKEMAEMVITEGVTVRQLRAAANRINSGGLIEEVPQNFSQSAPTNVELKEGKIRKAALSTLRVALIRIGDLLESLDAESSKTRRELMRMRQEVHDLIDEFLSFEPASQPQTEEVASLVKDRFLKYFNSGQVSQLAKIRAKDQFTIFDDYPLSLMNLKQSLKNDLLAFRRTHARNCTIEDLEIRPFANGNAAVATFLFLQNHEKNGKEFSWRSRVTFVVERKDAEWRVVHEHWSQADLDEKISRRIRHLNSKLLA